MKNLVVAIAYVGMFVVIVLMAKGLSNTAYQTDQVRAGERQRVETGLAEQLIFPEGWTPLTCESSGRDNNSVDCVWVCRSNNNDDLYRYCQPIIQSVDSE